MSWIAISFCVIGVWSMLTVFGGERRRQVMEQEAVKRAQAEAAAAQENPTV